MALMFPISTFVQIQIKRIFHTNLQEFDLVPKEGRLSFEDHRAAFQICCLVVSVSCQENKRRQNVESTDKKYRRIRQNCSWEKKLKRPTLKRLHVNHKKKGYREVALRNRSVD